ncbi:MAG: glycosyltransferase [Ignavibacteria bacterium]|nr:glycosyltransferase [Ignavibacteria bacterium]
MRATLPKSSKKITVLNVMTSIEDGGLEMLVYRIYRGLDKSKYNLKIVSLTPFKYNFLENDFKNLGADLYEFDFRNKGKGLKDTIHNIVQFFEFVKFLIQINADVIHSHDFFPALVTRSAVIFSLIRFSWRDFRLYSTYHNIYYWLKPLHHKINKFLSLFTDRIVCVSNSVKLDSQKKEKINEKKYKVIFNGIDENEFCKNEDFRKIWRNKLGYSDEEFVISNVAVLCERKGQIYLLEAFNSIKDKFKNARLLLVGGVREHEEYYAEMLRNYIDQNSLKDLVKIQSPIREIKELYNALDLFVMPSVTEGFGLSAFEAMLTEKICLFSDIPPFLELIDDGINGFIFKVSNSNSTAEKLDYVMENISNLTEIPQNARNHVINNYSLKNMVREYDLLYSDSKRNKH